MKNTPSTLARAITAFFVLAVLFGSATQAQNSKHHHYKVIDLGTFGGPGGGSSSPASPSLNKFAMSVGLMDTAALDPFAPLCFLDCYVDLGF